ncbi:MAG: dTDP-4-dehydrorhamnose reductase [Candidatus Bathyarchaeota archaeon]|nr:dTDP-4-dehydrorhamnose reductase [Candidatus Bathyarchaeota archaeon]
MTTRTLVTGASGLLGSKVAQMASLLGLDVYSSYNDHQVSKNNSLQIDLRNKDQVKRSITSVKPDHVIHCAALSDVDKCENNQELAWSINVEGTRAIIKASEAIGASLVFVSTDYVFQGDAGGYKEEDAANPINYYGCTKLQAESLVKKMKGDWTIVRPSVIYGSVPAAGKINFALWIINKLQRKEPIKIITDQWVSPTLNTNLSHMILEIIQRRLPGVYHLAGATPISRYNFAIKIATEFNLDERLISPSLSKDMSWVAKRPINSSLNVKKASKTLNAKPLMIKEAMSQLKKEIEENER